MVCVKKILKRKESRTKIHGQVPALATQAKMKKRKKKSGIRLLLEKYRTLFQTAENQTYHLPEDFSDAERKFLKHALEQRRIEIQEDLFE